MKTFSKVDYCANFYNFRKYVYFISFNLTHNLLVGRINHSK